MLRVEVLGKAKPQLVLRRLAMRVIVPVRWLALLVGLDLPGAVLDSQPSVLAVDEVVCGRQHETNVLFETKDFRLWKREIRTRFVFNPENGQGRPPAVMSAAGTLRI